MINLNWYGQACYKIEAKGVIIATDPYDRKCGLRLPKIKADILTISHDHPANSNKKGIAGNPFIIDRPGEYEIKGVFIKGISTWHDKKEGKEKGKNVIYRITCQEIKIAHLGHLAHNLSDEQLSELGDIDILLIPVGGDDTLNAKEASGLINQIEPRLVVPMSYNVPGLKEKAEGINKFISEMGLKNQEPQEKLKISKRDLPQEETEIVLLRC